MQDRAGQGRFGPASTRLRALSFIGRPASSPGRNTAGTAAITVNSMIAAAAEAWPILARSNAISTTNLPGISVAFAGTALRHATTRS